MYGNERKYLRKLGVFKCRITKVATKPAKGKHEEKLAITFESQDGSLIDQDFKLSSLKPGDESPGGKWAKKTLKSIMTLAAVAKPSELVGKEMAVLVEPSFWEDKGPFWNPRNFYDVKYLLGEEALLAASLDGMTDLLGDDFKL
jgi:hypothetical protein